MEKKYRLNSNRNVLTHCAGLGQSQVDFVLRHWQSSSFPLHLQPPRDEDFFGRQELPWHPFDSLTSYTVRELEPLPRDDCLFRLMKAVNDTNFNTFFRNYFHFKGLTFNRRIFD